MIQSTQPINLRKEFRIGSCNFSLQACRWKSINFRQKTKDNSFVSNNRTFSVIPNVRLNQTSVVLAQHIYMFGGIPEGMQNTNFCAINLKNNKWHQIKLQSTPCPRDSHGFTVLKQQIYAFGGSNRDTYFNDLHSFNNFTNGWTIVQNKGQQTPSPRDSMIFLSVKNQYLLLIGGVNFLSQNKYFQDVFIWRNKQWKQLQSNYPSRLLQPKGVEINGKVFIFGGIDRQTGEYSSKLYEVIINEQANKAQFTEVKLNIQVFPEGRINHQLLKVNNQYFLLIGGQRLNKKIYKDIWAFDLFTNKWTRIQPKNGPLRGIHSFSAVMLNNIIYMIGGFLQNRKQINDLVLTLQFANQQIFKSQVCQNCVNILEKKQQQSKKFPKDLTLSIGFLYNIALQIKFPFHAISMLYQASKYFHAKQFRINSEKTLNNFNYLKISFNGCSFGRQQFISFISHTGFNQQLKKFTENIKLGALRLGKTFLFVTSDKQFRYVFLLSAQSRISPHFDQAYIYYAYIENIELQRIETQEGIKQRQLIFNILSTHLSKPQIALSTMEKSLILIFQNKVVMSSQREYICELQSDDFDIRIWKNDKKLDFLQQRGYPIREDVQISLRKWMALYYSTLLQHQTQFYFNQNDQPVKFVQYKVILDYYSQKGVLSKVQLPNDPSIQYQGQIYITNSLDFLQNNYGLLIYSQGRLYSRFMIDFGKLFPQHFYKSKYKQARTIFYEVGFINIKKGLEENIFKNGFLRHERYSLLLEKIQEKCDQKRRELEQQNQQSDEEESKTTKKVKV